ncbi:MAG: MerR family transcriptional regulator [Prevotellaceae bacterium]|jgi:DNA-binding transcriptional MerR regulator|nr:MerR family transcriptional regulator [Prevotellaceae bacterium]
MKQFYSIAEVAEIVGENQSLLRFWEKEFEGIIAPQRSPKGIRLYRLEDVEMVKLVHHLVKTLGLTLDGAKQRIKNNKTAARRNREMHESLRAIREELVTLRRSLTLPGELEEEQL